MRKRRHLMWRSRKTWVFKPWMRLMDIQVRVDLRSDYVGQSVQSLMSGEIGSYSGFRFIESKEVPK